MRIIIRADSSREIGTGHLMRLKTLILQMNAITHPKHLSFIIISYPFEGHVLNIFDHIENVEIICLKTDDSFGQISDYNYVRYHLIEELSTIKSYIMQLEANMLIIDHYEINCDYEHALYNLCFIAVIDDFPNRSHYCHLIFNQNLNLNYDAMYKDSFVKDRLLGPNVALLRDEFLELSPQSTSKSIKSVLISFGGTDPTNETLKTLHAMKNMNLNLHVVMGSSYFNNHEKMLRKIKTTQMTYYVNINNISTIMAQCDLAIGAGGSSGIERLYMKIPTITIAVAENQIPFSKAVHAKQFGIYLGISENVTSKMIAEMVRRLSQDNVQYDLMIKKLNCQINHELIRNKPLANKLINVLEVGSADEKYS